jgi:penicillin-binding protein 2B
VIPTRGNTNNYWDKPMQAYKVSLVVIGILYLFFCYLDLSPVIYGKNMDAFAANRNTVKTTLPANRGTIYDKDSNILSINVSSYTVIAYLSANRTGSNPTPLHVVDKEGTALALAPILGMDASYILKLLSKEVYQVELGPGGRAITELKKEEIEDLNLPGIDFIEKDKRYYPNGDFASYITGYAKSYDDEESGTNGYTIVGELGIESKYNDLLSGIDGYLEYQKDRFGYKIPDTKETRINPIDGNNIYLTIDSTIQRFMEDAVDDSVKNYNPEWLVLTAMDAKTGDILGSVSTPSYDPNKLNITNYQLPLTSYLYEPGSTMKTYTYMCAIDKGTYDGNETYKSGQITIETDTINDWNQTGFGTITFDKGFEYSSNVGVANIVQKYITKTELKLCLGSYGFGKTTDIELPHEVNGDISFNYPIEVAAAAFGQGISSTPIQQLQALTIIANNGKMLTPHIISKIVDPNTGEVTYERKVESTDQLVKESTIAKIKELMYNTVNNKDKWTTGTAYYIDGFDIIGKTGTAQIFDPKTGKYLNSENQVIHSFAGMFPKDDPEIIIYGAMKKPTTGKSAGLYKPTKEIISSIAKYLNIYHTENPNINVEEYTMPSFINKNITDVTNILNQHSLDIVVIGNGNVVVKQVPSNGSTVISGDKIFLVTNDSKFTMPSLIGWSRMEAITLLSLYNLNYELDGYGYVTTQSIAPNTLIKGDEVVTLNLTKKYNLDIPEE